MPELSVSVSSLDWSIAAVYILAMVGVGVYTNRFVSSLDNYLVAGRQVRTGLAIATMVGTEVGLVTIAYASQKGYVEGFSAYHIAVVAMLTCMVVGLTGFVISGLRKAGVMTIPEYYEQRFGRRVRIVGGVILVLAGVLNMGPFLRAGADFVAGFTGMAGGEYETRIKLIMTVLLLVVLVYTILGGMLSVVITDYLQFLVIGASFVVMTAICLRDIGWDHAVQTVAAHKGLGGFDPAVSEGFGPLYVAWQFLLTFTAVSLWQPATLRALIAANPGVAKRTYFWSSLGFFTRFVVPYFWGICAFVWIVDTPSLRQMFAPASEGGAGMSIMLATPMFLSAHLPVIVKGIVMAGLLAAFMGTHDSYFICWSSSIVQDIIAPLRRGELSPRARILLTRLFILLIGAFLLFWGLWYKMELHLWDYMGVTASIYLSGAFAVVAGGLYWKRASARGAMAALLLGLFAVLGILPWADWTAGLDAPLAAAVRTAFKPAVIGLWSPALSVAGLVAGSLLWPDRNGKEAAA